jgi:hypothetical protein
MRVTDPVGRYNAGRARAWYVVFIGGIGGSPVILRNCAKLAPGEDLTEDPPSHELTWDEWMTRHASYGLDIDGKPIAGGP